MVLISVAVRIKVIEDLQVFDFHGARPRARRVCELHPGLDDFHGDSIRFITRFGVSWQHRECHCVFLRSPN